MPFPRRVFASPVHSNSRLPAEKGGAPEAPRAKSKLLNPQVDTSTLAPSPGDELEAGIAASGCLPIGAQSPMTEQRPDHQPLDKVTGRPRHTRHRSAVASWLKADVIPGLTDVPRFSEAEVRNATEDFTCPLPLQPSAAVHVYKGVLPSGQEITVKCKSRSADLQSSQQPSSLQGSPKKSPFTSERAPKSPRLNWVPKVFASSNTGRDTNPSSPAAPAVSPAPQSWGMPAPTQDPSLEVAFPRNSSADEGFTKPRTMAAEAREAQKGLRNELRILTSLRHPNIVRLQGYFRGHGNLGLLFSGAPLGSLRMLLDNDPALLTWQRRLQIARGVALALDHMHTRDGATVVHRSLKSTSILVRRNFEPLLSSFEQAVAGAGESAGHPQPRDIMGYQDPDPLARDRVCVKSDVYSFGVLMLELATGWGLVRDGRHIASKVASSVNKGGFLKVLAPELQPELKTRANSRSRHSSVGVDLKSRYTHKAAIAAASSQVHPQEVNSPQETKAGNEQLGRRSKGSNHSAPLRATQKQEATVSTWGLTSTSFQRFVSVAMACCRPNADGRPNMRLVAEEIEVLMGARTKNPLPLCMAPAPNEDGLTFEEKLYISPWLR